MLPGWLRALMIGREPSALVRYVGALAAIAVTAAIQLALFAASAPWFLYTPAVVLVALALGTGAGVFATILASLAAGYAVSGLGASLLLLPVHWAASLIFILTTLGLVALVRALKAALRQADALHHARNQDALKSAEREAFLSSVLSASTDCIKVVELAGSLSFMSEGGMGVMEISDFNDVRGCAWPSLLKDEGPGLATEAIAAARLGKTSHFETDANTYLGTPKHWSVSVSPIRSTGGDVSRILSVSRDHTALAEAREQQHLLNGELSHRLKNTLAVVQAIASQTFGSSDPEATAAFGSRLIALSTAHDVLLQRSWSAASVRDVASRVLATFNKGEQITLDGPDLTMGPRATLALSLLVHELATNATKYGAFSTPAGHVTLAWSTTGGGDTDTVFLQWAERGGPPAVAPIRKGFGSRIIRMGLTGSGGVGLRYEEEGFTADMTATIEQLRRA